MSYFVAALSSVVKVTRKQILADKEHDEEERKNDEVLQMFKTQRREDEETRKTIRDIYNARSK